MKLLELFAGTHSIGKVAKKKGGADEYGKTHYVEVDTWKPTEKKAVAEPVDDGLPF